MPFDATEARLHKGDSSLAERLNTLFSFHPNSFQSSLRSELAQECFPSVIAANGSELTVTASHDQEWQKIDSRTDL